MRGRVQRVGLAAAALLFPGAGYGYHHFVHYYTRTAPYTPVYEKFDLNALPGRTVQFQISEQGPALLAPNDSLAAVYSQIRAAARVWNDVGTSELRIAFGGIGNPAAPQATPGIDVVFEEVPPGLVALGGPSLRADVAADLNGPFVPITRSVLVIRRDLSTQPSYSEAFFSTLVHEFGHTLGLQHTLTSAAMSTGLTRATTKSKPLAADDIAGLSILYPAAGFAASTGAISGRVTMGGEGVSLASVVAISPNGPAVSALTHPDGTYRIEGIPAGLQYLVYVHPLPPAMTSLGEVSPANLVLPRDAAGNPVAPSAAFDTVFFPGVKNPNQAAAITVLAGQSVDGVHFNVQRRASVPVYAVQSYSFIGSVTVKPATLNRFEARPYMVVQGAGLSVNNAPAPGLGISLIGGGAVVPPASIRAYPYAAGYIQFDVELSQFAPDGPYHLVFSLANDIYVLPAAFQVASLQPPAIVSVAAGPDPAGGRAALVTGSNLTAATRFLFDGQPAARVAEDGGRFVVTPPPGTAGHRASLVAVNSDGQSSLFSQAVPPVYVYETGDAPLAALSPAALPAGAESMVEISAPGAGFLEGQTQIGFGTSDVSVRRLWVASPTRLLANVSVSPQAASLPSTLTIVNGLQMATQPLAFQVQPANPRQLMLSPAVTSASGQTGIQAASLAVVGVPGLTQGQIQAGLSLTLSGAPAQIVNAVPGQITFLVPAGTPPGPAVLRLQAGSEASLPIVIMIELPSPTVMAALAGGVPVDSSRPARAPELVTLVAGNLGDAPAPARLRLTVGGIEHQISLLAPVPNQPGVYQVGFFLNPAVPAGSQPVILSLDGRASSPFALAVRGQ